jgi:hypothetical protein
MSENNANTTVESKANIISPVDKEMPITVTKKVTLFRKEEASAYYKRNAKFMPEGKVKIGSAINSVNRMKSNLEEINFYMPLLLGLNRNDPKYSEQVDLWFNNISKIVPESGLTLEVGFIYNNAAHKSTIDSLEEQIYKKFNGAKKSNVRDRDEAIKVRDAAIIDLEKTKYLYGRPINVADYLLWRYCLVYTDVANDIALINKSGGIRFYIYDSEREKQKEKIQFEVRKKATTIYVKLLDMPDRVETMLWVDKGQSADITKIDEIDKYRMIENMSKANPAEFINLYEDINLETKAIIERMIHYGIIKRLQGSSVIVDEHNDLIGNTMDEAIIFFKNTERNKATITRLQSKLKDYRHE